MPFRIDLKGLISRSADQSERSNQSSNISSQLFVGTLGTLEDLDQIWPKLGQIIFHTALLAEGVLFIVSRLETSSKKERGSRATLAIAPGGEEISLCTYGLEQVGAALNKKIREGTRETSQHVRVTVNNVLIEFQMLQSHHVRIPSVYSTWWCLKALWIWLWPNHSILRNFDCIFFLRIVSWDDFLREHATSFCRPGVKIPPPSWTAQADPVPKNSATNCQIDSHFLTTLFWDLRFFQPLSPLPKKTTTKMGVFKARGDVKGVREPGNLKMEETTSCCYLLLLLLLLDVVVVVVASCCC